MDNIKDIVENLTMLIIDDKRWEELVKMKPKVKGSIAVAVENLNGKPYILFHEDILKYDKDIQKIVLAHECAHALGGIEDEEEADRWTLEALNTKQQTILKEMWKDRHGHEYEYKEGV